MTVEFPLNTIILINVGIIGISIGMWLMLSDVLNSMGLSPQSKRNWRLGTAVVLLAWLAVRLALEITATQPLGVVPTIGFVAFGLVIGTLPLNRSATFRQIIRATPLTWLVGLQIVRVVGGTFLVLLDMKLLPAAFALPAGYGDVAVGVLAVPVVYFLATNKPYARTAAVLWNLLGILDLVIALSTGSTFIAPYMQQLGASGVSLTFLNYVLIIPAYGVPLALLLHIYTLYSLRAKGAEANQRPAETPVSGAAFAK
jgi:hypothetical protein